MLHSLKETSNAIMVRREDGFEKRYPSRCTRCNLVVAYHLDWSQFATDEQSEQIRNQKERRDDVLYVLPGSVLTTEKMRAGIVPTDKKISFGLAATPS